MSTSKEVKKVIQHFDLIHQGKLSTGVRWRLYVDETKSRKKYRKVVEYSPNNYFVFSPDRPAPIYT